MNNYVLRAGRARPWKNWSWTKEQLAGWLGPGDPAAGRRENQPACPDLMLLSALPDLYDERRLF